MSLENPSVSRAEQIERQRLEHKKNLAERYGMSVEDLDTFAEESQWPKPDEMPTRIDVRGTVNGVAIECTEIRKAPDTSKDLSNVSQYEYVTTLVESGTEAKPGRRHEITGDHARKLFSRFRYDVLRARDAINNAASMDANEAAELEFLAKIMPEADAKSILDIRN